MSVHPRTKALSALARFQVAEATVVGTLSRIAEITLEAMPSAAFVGITMLGEDGQPTTAVYTNQESSEIDAAQYRQGKGPCLDAWRHKKVFRLSRVDRSASEYPAFAAACAEHGVQSTLSLPMISGAVAVGAMNLYAHVPDGFSDDDEAVGMDLAGAGGSVLERLVLDCVRPQPGPERGHEDPSRDRAGHGHDHGPFTRPHRRRGLRPAPRGSQRENVKLKLIAQRIVERAVPNTGPA